MNTDFLLRKRKTHNIFSNHLFSKIGVIAKYTALESRRNYFFLMVFVVITASIGLAEFVSKIAITESQQIQSAVLGSVLRMMAVLSVSLFVISSMSRELNEKGIELVLSLSLPRAGYYFGKLAGFWLVALLVALLFSLSLLIYVPLDQVIIWGLSLCFELLIVVAVSLFCLFTLNHVVIVFICVFAFYLLSRSIGVIQLIGHGPLADMQQPSQQLINFIINVVSSVLPTLDRFTLTEWLVYHTATVSDLVFVISQSVVYLLFLTGITLFDLYRKNL